VQQETDVREGRADAPSPELPPADWAAADEMRRRTFTVSEQGYSQDEVRAYLTHLAEVFANQAAQLSEMRRAQSETPPPAPQNGGEDPSGLATKIADVLKEAGLSPEEYRQFLARYRTALEDAPRRPLGNGSEDVPGSRTARLPSDRGRRDPGEIREGVVVRERVEAEKGQRQQQDDDEDLPPQRLLEAVADDRPDAGHAASTNSHVSGQRRRRSSRQSRHDLKAASRATPLTRSHRPPRRGRPPRASR